MPQKNTIQWATRKTSTTISSRKLISHQPHSTVEIKNIFLDCTEMKISVAWYVLFNHLLLFSLKTSFLYLKNNEILALIFLHSWILIYIWVAGFWARVLESCWKFGIFNDFLGVGRVYRGGGYFKKEWEILKGRGEGFSKIPSINQASYHNLHVKHANSLHYKLLKLFPIFYKS